MQLGRPVKWAEDRLENMLAAPQGRGLRASVELALDADGRILALRGRLLADLGAYLLPSTAMPPHTAAMLLTGSYDIQAVDVIVTGARTNKVPTAPYRGAGRPEATYLIETTIDAAARAAAASTRSSCAAATSCARSRTGPRSAGPTTPATSSAASTPRWR